MMPDGTVSRAQPVATSMIALTRSVAVSNERTLLNCSEPRLTRPGMAREVSVALGAAETCYR
jgi:hypothetical protein